MPLQTPIETFKTVNSNTVRNPYTPYPVIPYHLFSNLQYRQLVTLPEALRTPAHRDYGAVGELLHDAQRQAVLPEVEVRDRDLAAARVILEPLRISQVIPASALRGCTRVDKVQGSSKCSLE